MKEALKDGAVGKAANDLIAETVRCIRQYPLSAAATAFGGGLLAGWLISRKLQARRHAGRERRWRTAFEDEANRRAVSRWENEGGAYRDIPQSSHGAADNRL